MRTPSIKALREVFGDKAKQAKAILKMNRAELETLPAGDRRCRECYTPPTVQDLRFHCLDALGETFGVEAFQLRDCTWVEYLNTGDAYTPTLLKWNGNYYVKDWGSIAERYA